MVTLMSKPHSFHNSYLTVKDVLQLRQDMLTFGHPSAGVHPLNETVQVIQLQGGGRGEWREVEGRAVQKHEVYSSFSTHISS